MNIRDKDKRLKGFGIPIEVCVKYERAVGIPAGVEPTKQQRAAVTKLMVDVLTAGVSNVVLNSEDYELIAQEVKRNESKH